MKTFRTGLALAAVSLIAGAALAQPPAAPSSSLTPPPNAPPPRETAPGPLAVTVEANPGLMTHTIYRPANLAAVRANDRLPIVAWGNGACSNAGLLFSNFLRQIASHGYMVIASGPLNAPLPAYASGRTTNPKPDGSVPAGQTKDEDLIKAIDWAIAENGRAGSPYAGKLDPSKVAVMGQSCGGLQATWAAADPRVKTAVIWNSGVFVTAAPSPGGRSMSGATKDSLKKFHAPVAYFLGGPSDSAYPNGSDDFAKLTTVPAFFGSINSGHGGTYQHPGGGWFGYTAVKWLDWRLKGDAQAAKVFAGPDCELCRNPIWEVKRKNM